MAGPSEYPRCAEKEGRPSGQGWRAGVSSGWLLQELKASAHVQGARGGGSAEACRGCLRPPPGLAQPTEAGLPGKEGTRKVLGQAGGQVRGQRQPRRLWWSQQLWGPLLGGLTLCGGRGPPEPGGRRVMGPGRLGVKSSCGWWNGGPRAPRVHSSPALRGPKLAYLVSRSGPERLGKRLEAAKCSRHTAPRGGAPGAGLQGARSGGWSSGRPKWHRCRPGGAQGWPRRPHPRLQVPIQPLRVAASSEREAERRRSADQALPQASSPLKAVDSPHPAQRVSEEGCRNQSSCPTSQPTGTPCSGAPGRLSPAAPTPCYFRGDTDTGGHTPLPGLQPGIGSGAPTQSAQAQTGATPSPEA